MPDDEPCPQQHLTDEEARRLVARVTARDPEAARRFFAHFRELLYSVLLSGGSLSRDEADELFQRLFEHLAKDDYHRLGQWQGRGSLTAYLCTIARNLRRDYYRERARQPLPGDPPDEQLPGPGPGPAETFDLEYLLECAQQAILRLRARDQELIRRVDIDGQRYRAVAAALDMNENSVAQALHRARARLRAECERRCPGFAQLFARS